MESGPRLLPDGRFSARSRARLSVWGKMAVPTHEEIGHIEGPRQVGPSWQPSIRITDPVLEILDRSAASSTPILYEIFPDPFRGRAGPPRFRPLEGGSEADQQH